jgi:hypothetical protein
LLGSLQTSIKQLPVSAQQKKLRSQQQKIALTFQTQKHNISKLLKQSNQLPTYRKFKMKNVIKAIIVTAAFLGMTNAALAATAQEKAKCLEIVDTINVLYKNNYSKMDTTLLVLKKIESRKETSVISKRDEVMFSVSTIDVMYSGLSHAKLKEICLK